MDPTHSRPWDVRPIGGDNPSDDNKCYQRIFVARITNLLETRHNIGKRAILDELYRLRQVVASAADTANDHPQSYASSAHRVHSSRSCDALAPSQFTEGTSETSTRPIVARQTPLFERQYQQRDSSYNSFLRRRNECSGASIHNCKSANSSPESFLLVEALSKPRPHPKPARLPYRQVGAEKPSSSSSSHNGSDSISSSLEVNVKRFPMLNDVMSAYQCFKEMNKAYNSTVSPFSVTYSARKFLTTEEQHLDPDRMLILHSNTPSLEPSLRPAPALPNLLKLHFTHRFPVPFHGRHYIPPLLARLFFERELALLFDSQLHFTYSAEGVSLAKAKDLYVQELFPARYSSSVSHTASHTASRSSQVQFRQENTRSTPIPHRETSEKISSKSPSTVLPFPHEVRLSHGTKTFQRRTFYRSVTRTAELRAPAASWCDDTVHADASLGYTRPVQSHHAYVVSSDARGIPFYIDLPGVHSGQGSASVTLAFGFQRQTNYPFRRTYNQPRRAETFLVPPKVPPRVSGEFESRVPASGLSLTLLHLFQPDMHRGVFFSNAQNESLTGLESKPPKLVYSISAEGKLVQDGVK